MVRTENIKQCTFQSLCYVVSVSMSFYTNMKSVIRQQLWIAVHNAFTLSFPLRHDELYKRFDAFYNLFWH